MQHVRSRRGVWVGAALAAGAVAAIATAAFGTAWMTSILQPDRWRSRYALSTRLEELAVPAEVSRLLAYAALMLPWFSTWPVALAAVGDDVAAQVVAIALAAYLLPDRIPL